MLEQEDKVKFLMRYGRLKERMIVLLERRRAYETDIYGIKSTNYSEELRGGGLPSNLDDKIVKLLSVTKEIDAELKEVTRKMEYIKGVINRLKNDKYKSLLELKYIDGMTVSQMSVIVNRSVIYVKSNTRRGIEILPIQEEDRDFIT